MPECFHCKTSVNEFLESPDSNPASAKKLNPAYSVVPNSGNDLRNRWMELMKELIPLMEWSDSRRKFGSQLRQYMAEIKFETPQWQEQMTGTQNHPLTSSYCPKCGTIQRTFYKGYEEEQKLVTDFINSNKKSINYVEDMLPKLNNHIAKLEIEDKKAKEVAKKKALEEKRKAEISNLQNRLEELKKEEE